MDEEFRAELAKLVQAAVSEQLSEWGLIERRAAIKAERERRDLDATNWDKEPFITHHQLEIMSRWRAWMIMSDPKWVDDPYRLVLRNTKHPDNEPWINRRDFLQRADELEWTK